MQKHSVSDVKGIYVCICAEDFTFCPARISGAGYRDHCPFYVGPASTNSTNRRRSDEDELCGKTKGVEKNKNYFFFKSLLSLLSLFDQH